MARYKDQINSTGFKNLKLILKELDPKTANRMISLVDAILQGANGNAYHLSYSILKEIQERE